MHPVKAIIKEISYNYVDCFDFLKFAVFSKDMYHNKWANKICTRKIAKEIDY